MNRLPKIKWYRLLLAFGITFVIADTYPHPRLSPGLIQSATASATEAGKATLDTLLAHSLNSRESDLRQSPGLAQADFQQQMP